jgi:hypothetical protein
MTLMHAASSLPGVKTTSLIDHVISPAKAFTAELSERVRAEEGSEDTVMDAHVQNAVNADIILFIALISFLI